jgi:hypothetical protein
MKTEFTKEQYQNLIELVFLGNWTINAFNIETEEKYDELEQYIFAQARDYDQADLVQGPNPSQKLLDVVLTYIQNYNECLFWTDLAARLAERDLERKYGEALEKMDDDEIHEKEDEIKEKYLEIFEKNGLDTIDVNP